MTRGCTREVSSAQRLQWIPNPGKRVNQEGSAGTCPNHRFLISLSLSPSLALSLLLSPPFFKVVEPDYPASPPVGPPHSVTVRLLPESHRDAEGESVRPGSSRRRVGVNVVERFCLLVRHQCQTDPDCSTKSEGHPIITEQAQKQTTQFLTSSNVCHVHLFVLCLDPDSSFGSHSLLCITITWVAASSAPAIRRFVCISAV